MIEFPTAEAIAIKIVCLPSLFNLSHSLTVNERVSQSIFLLFQIVILFEPVNPVCLLFLSFTKIKDFLSLNFRREREREERITEISVDDQDLKSLFFEHKSHTLQLADQKIIGRKIESSADEEILSFILFRSLNGKCCKN